ncbi:unnamed protein product [Rangifer tarandus platyrhynchus]|uniref:Uncharacterized protein n=1 Tax=Rangifer tarandus platyrhynchus TaxID=3082113 RepID=A0ABN8ZRU0_RANTA|nr:unnamed protein product [Rangifer tarandus platyrhynchus]
MYQLSTHFPLQVHRFFLLFSTTIFHLVTQAHKEMNHLLELSLLYHKHSIETPWTVAYQAPPSMGFSRQDWCALPFPSPGDLPDPGIKPWSPSLEADALTSEPPGCLQTYYFH